MSRKHTRVQERFLSELFRCNKSLDDVAKEQSIEPKLLRRWFGDESFRKRIEDHLRMTEQMCQIEALRGALTSSATLHRIVQRDEPDANQIRAAIALLSRIARSSKKGDEEVTDWRRFLHANSRRNGAGLLSRLKAVNRKVPHPDPLPQAGEGK